MFLKMTLSIYIYIHTCVLMTGACALGQGRVILRFVRFCGADDVFKMFLLWALAWGAGRQTGNGRAIGKPTWHVKERSNLFPKKIQLRKNLISKIYRMYPCFL